MPSVNIQENYAVGCESCLAAMTRLICWVHNDPQCNTLTLRQAKTCQHQPEKPPSPPQPEPTLKFPEKETPPPPPPPETLFNPENLPASLAGTGYDEP